MHFAMMTVLGSHLQDKQDVTLTAQYSDKSYKSMT